VNPYLAGEKLYGEDLRPDQIEAWYNDEKEAYAELGAKDAKRYRYEYHALNTRHGFRHLPKRIHANVLGFGSAYGHEFEPLAGQILKITMVEPSDAFSTPDVLGVPTTYAKPQPDGALPFPDSCFDLCTCFAVLHHLPNVSRVLQELYRCLKPDGFALIREPVISMGDWTSPRRGLTKHERGIPLKLFRDMLQSLGFIRIRETLCMLSIITGVSRVFRFHPYNVSILTWLDEILSRSLRWNLRYHSTTTLGKIRPTNVFFVLTK
jgi:SAM-dependent methyltransferase